MEKISECFQSLEFMIHFWEFSRQTLLVFVKVGKILFVKTIAFHSELTVRIARYEGPVIL